MKKYFLFFILLGFFNLPISIFAETEINVSIKPDVKLNNIDDKIKNFIPENIRVKIEQILEPVEKFRLNKLAKITEIKELTKERLRIIKEENTNIDVPKSEREMGDATVEPIATIKYYLFCILTFIFMYGLLFYLVCFLIIIYIIKFLFKSRKK